MPETVSTYRAMQVRAAEAPLLAAGEPLMRRAAAALAAGDCSADARWGEPGGRRQAEEEAPPWSAEEIGGQGGELE